MSTGIAIIYWSTSSLFEAMGNLNQLPPAMAAWWPDILFGLAGTYLLLRIKGKRQPQVMSLNIFKTFA